MKQLNTIGEYLESALASRPTDPFTFILQQFVSNHDEVEELHALVEDAIDETQALWTFFGETPDPGTKSDLQTIFKFIHDFAAAFKKIYKDRKAQSTQDLVAVVPYRTSSSSRQLAPSATK
jgi:hypothetical protein